MLFHGGYESANVMNKEKSFRPFPISLDANAYVPGCSHKYGSDSDNKKSSMFDRVKSGRNTTGQDMTKR